MSHLHLTVDKGLHELVKEMEIWRQGPQSVTKPKTGLWSPIHQVYISVSLQLQGSRLILVTTLKSGISSFSVLFKAGLWETIY
jgi:hypothetical protein